MPRILYVAPESDTCRDESRRLSDAGYAVVWEHSVADAARCMAAGDVDVVVAQAGLADGDVFDVLRASYACTPSPPLVRVCAEGRSQRYPADTTAVDLVSTIVGIIDGDVNPGTTVDDAASASALALAEVGTCEWHVGADHVRLSRVAADLLGFADRSLVSLSELSARVHPDDRRHSTLQLGRIVQHGADPALELRFIMPDESIRWLQCRSEVRRDTEGRAVLLRAVIRDDTTVKYNAQQQEAALRLLEAAERIGNIGSWQWDLATNEATWSPELYRIYGRDPAQGPPDLHEYTTHIHPDDRERLAAAIQDSFSAGSYEAEYRLFRYDDGSERTVLARGEVQYDSHGNPSHHLGAVIDISQVRQLQRLEAIGTMAAGISHDFNNSLTVILWAAHLLGRPTESRSPGMTTERLVQMIVDAAKGSSQKVNQLREFYRVHAEEDEMPLVDLVDVAREAIDLTRPRWVEQAQAAGISLQIKTDLEPVNPINGQAHELREAVTNLIINAADAMTTSGILSIATRAYPEHILLTVSDTGAGMSEETRKRCLDPFYTTKGERGTGLGLAMVQSTMRRHGGGIEIESVPKVGTTISLIFPNQLATVVEDLPDELERTTGKRILVVDDEPDVLQLLVELLLFDDHLADGVADASAALAMLASTAYDLVFIDRAMPVMNGDQLAEVIHERHPGLPIIMLTGFGKLMNDREMVLTGVDHILAKPIQMDELRQAIARVVGRS